MNADDREELMALAEQVQPECGATITYGRLVVACTRPVGHPAGRHEAEGITWTAA